MNKPTKEELIAIHEMMCKASKHFDEVIKKQIFENGGSQLAIELLNMACVDQEAAHRRVQEMSADWVLKNWEELNNKE